MKIEDLTLEYGQQTTKLYDQFGRVFTLTIAVDECMGNPQDDDEYFGEIKSLNRRHYNFCDPDEVNSLEELREYLDNNHKHWRQLSYYEHGSSVWWPTKDGNPGCPDMRWDGAGFAGWWVPSEQFLKDWTEQGLSEEELQEKIDECCTAVCKTYTQWCNGQIFYYNVELDDSAYDGEEIMSCGGYYGSDHKESGLLDTLINELQCAEIREFKTERECQKAS